MAKRPQFNQYRGPLTAAQAAEGIQAAIRNAQSLMQDARILLDASRWARAAALSILAIEEVGKIPILRMILLARDEAELKEEWNRYRSHTSKNVHHMVPALVLQGARQLEDFRSMYEDPGEPFILDKMKQVAFYSDCPLSSSWIVPEQAVTDKVAQGIFATGEACTRSASSSFSSAEELEIFKKHMQPVWKGPMPQMKKAMFAAYEEAKNKGLMAGVDLETVAKFLSIQTVATVQ